MSETTEDRPGPGWGNICRDCFGCKIEWTGVRRCECTAGKIALPKADQSQNTSRYPKQVRMVRPGYIGIRIGDRGTEYVMSVSEANDLIGMINRAKHDGESDAD